MDQATLWNGPAGRAWVESQEILDGMFGPLEERLAEEAAGAISVLDIGCGTGGTTLAIARRQSAGGRVMGVDVSEPMLALAGARGEREGSSATFTRADAQTFAFEPESFDLVTSRFGVMFFADFVAAFRNIRRAVREGGGLRMVAWRGPEENPFMTVAERAAAPLLPEMPPRDPDAPGQFAFADAQRVRRILEESGWGDIVMEPLDVACSFAERDLDRYLTRLGPVGVALAEADEATRADVVGVVRAAFAPYVHGDEVRFNAACWWIRAANPTTR